MIHTPFIFRHQRKGMTLIEIIFSMAILGTVITITFGAALSAWRNAQAANQRTQAQYVAQDQIERLKARRNDKNFSWLSDATLGITGFVDEVLVNQGNNFSMDICNPTPPIPSPDPCTFKVVAGNRSYLVTGKAISDTDATPFTVNIQATGVFDSANDPLNAEAKPLGSVANDQIQAIQFKVTVTWPPATGRTDSSGVLDRDKLEAVTIITRKDIAQ